MGCDHLDTICGTRARFHDANLPETYVANPWMVIVFDESEYQRCGGVIVDSLHVLTSKTCFYKGENPESFKIRHGSNLITDNMQIISKLTHQVESFLFSDSFAILKMKRQMKFNNFVRPICVSEPPLNGVHALKAVGWKLDDFWDWDELSSNPVQLSDCSSDWEGREFNSDRCADQCKDSDCSYRGSYKSGDIIVATQNQRVYLYGVVNSEFHWTETKFSFDHLSPDSSRKLRRRLLSASPTQCDAGDFRCSSGVCLNESKVCDGVENCKDGSDELFCDPKPEECLSASCLNGGSCRLTNHRRECDCLAGFSGERCEINVDECEGVSCKLGSQCRDGIGKYSCLCPPGLTGKNCEKEVDECASNPCKHGGECTDLFSGFFCNCTGIWYKGKR